MSAAVAFKEADDPFDLLLPPDARFRAPAPAGAQPIALSGRTMGTGWTLEAVAPRTISPDRVEAVLAQCFACVIDQMSQWQSNSQITRFNKGAAGSRHRIGAQFRQVLECAFDIEQASGGAFDPALGLASEAWGFGPDAAENQFPQSSTVGRNRRRTVIDETGSILQPGGLQLDLSGIAKGFAVDLAIASLDALGIEHALLDIGGELKAIGLRADGLPWWVDLAVPPGSAAPATRIGLTGWAVATSGHWERRRQAKGRSWSHTLDPATGSPTNDALSSTVLHPGCMQADALATALIVMGMDEGIHFADRHKLPARIAGPDGAAESAAWRAWKG
ncbi:FAD:protein FMN transferase [Erythrobacter litoralis]|uniref:FAD:protein FMN transferase n=1 Tax=Erythrobacter litoralis TaxID=39960 RepID=UPI002434D618|nr:FAD:protein FMN transferase [Erythrobacter litoralis]MDG6077701.1 FAD:protein FMN transferase [Erythrobacter litoralis]